MFILSASELFTLLAPSETVLALVLETGTRAVTVVAGGCEESPLI